MAASQVTLRELLKDPIYRKWFGKVPILRFPPRGPAFRVYLLEESGGKWAKVEFEKYGQAYAFIRDNLKEIHDATINCGSQAFRPPVVRQGGKKRYYTPTPVLIADAETLNDAHKHQWCGYCRRPTLFLWYKRHHAFPKSFSPSPERRCRICGVRLVFNVQSYTTKGR